MVGLRKQENAVRFEHPQAWKDMVDQIRQAWKNEVMKITGWQADYFTGKKPLDIQHELSLLDLGIESPDLKATYRNEITTMWTLLCGDPF